MVEQESQERLYKGKVKLAELVEDSLVTFCIPDNTLREGKKIFCFKGVYIGKSGPGASGTWASFIFRREKHRFSYIKRREVGMIGIYHFQVLDDYDNEFIDFDNPHTRKSGDFNFEKLHITRHEEVYWKYDEILRRHGK